MRRVARILLLLSPLALAGCGFEPLYGRVGDRSVADDLAQIRVPPIAERSGQILRNHLLDRLTPRGQPEPARYTLRVVLTEPRPQDLGISRSDTVVRYGFQATADFRLFDAEGRELTRGRAQSSTSYAVTGSAFATIAGQTDARDRVLEEIALDVKAQLGLFFRSRRSPITG
jgi:LPS-assembly lipoprotein